MFHSDYKSTGIPWVWSVSFPCMAVYPCMAFHDDWLRRELWGVQNASPTWFCKHRRSLVQEQSFPKGIRINFPRGAGKQKYERGNELTKYLNIVITNHVDDGKLFPHSSLKVILFCITALAPHPLFPAVFLARLWVFQAIFLGISFSNTRSTESHSLFSRSSRSASPRAISRS